jgi:hypothetical protein
MIMRVPGAVSALSMMGINTSEQVSSTMFLQVSDRIRNRQKASLS